MNVASQKQDYVVGFLFKEKRSRVALIRKNRPDWQFGLLNGIGGKIEPGEAPDDAMVREFEEETGARTCAWRKFAILTASFGAIHFYELANDSVQIRSATDEYVDWYVTSGVPYLKVVPNLKWLIPMALTDKPVFAHLEDQ